MIKELTNIHNCRYDIHGNLLFDTDQGAYKISQKDAIELAYALFDSVGHSYNELDEIFAEIEE